MKKKQHGPTSAAAFGVEHAHGRTLHSHVTALVSAVCNYYPEQAAQKPSVILSLPSELRSVFQVGGAGGIQMCSIAAEIQVIQG